MKKLKSISKYIFILFTACLLSTIFILDAHANVYLDENNDMCIVTADQIRSSSIYYRTIGFTITRCAYNPATKEIHPAMEQFSLGLGDFTPEPIQVGGVETNIFRIPLSTLMSHMGGEWAQEVQDALDGGAPVYIRFDCRMIVYHGSTPLLHVFKNEFPSMDLNPSEIMRAEAWANPSGLTSHFNRYFMIGGNKEKPKEDIEADEFNFKVTEEETPIEYATGNESPDGYDLGEGIPSSKDVTNSYFASSWYGKTEVWARLVTTDKYTGIPYKFEWTLEYEVPQIGTRPDGSTYTYMQTMYKKQSPYTGTFDERLQNTTSMVPAVAFEYLVNSEFYDLEATGAYNLAYPGTIYYDSAIKVPMKAVATEEYVDISSEANGLKENSWYADTDKHVTWAEIDKSEKVVNLGTFRAESDAKRAMLEKFVSIKTELQDTVYENTTTKNDYLMIDNKEYLETYEDKGVNWTPDGNTPGSWTFCTESAAGKMPFEVGSITNASIGREEGSETVTIPGDTDNGKYPTGLEVTYTRKIKLDNKAKIFYADSAGEWFAAKENYESLSAGHCLDPYNGYINVHTPVIAPVSILDDKGEDVPGIENTQLETDIINPDASYQLLLDEDYVLDWEGEIHRGIPLYGDSGVPSKYDEFVEKKWMRFPFDVIYNGKFYEARPVTGDTGITDSSWSLEGKYTDWILIESPSAWDVPASLQAGTFTNGYKPKSDNHWQKTPIYIPSYAEECGELGQDRFIYYKVEAINSDGRYGGDHTKEQEEIFNKNYTYEYADDGAMYVATYRVQTQLSGIIYDFTITGSSDADTFMYEYHPGVVEGDHVPFCTYKMEKKVGNRNRFGDVAIRYRTDGALNRNWEAVNTLPLSAGKSNSWDKLGYVIKGSRFSYSFKTIANLWSENTDYIIIKPSFRYIRHDGTEAENFKIYYHSTVSEDKFVEYDPNAFAPADTKTYNMKRDAKNVQKVQLIHKEFNDSYYDELNSWKFNGFSNDYQIGNWLEYTCDYHNHMTGDDLTVQEMMYREVECFTLSQIRLNSNLRLLSGEWEQLKMNTKGYSREFEDIMRYSDEEYREYNGYDEGVPDYTEGLSNWDSALEDRFKRSMQTWYGQFYIPAELFIIDERDLQEKGISYGSFETFDLTEYINDKGGIREDDEIFVANEGSGGYLIINFEIHTKNEGKPHLKYFGTNGGTKDMWKTEGAEEEIEIEDVPGPIPLESGDVAIIDLSRSIKDKYKAAIFNIN